MNPDSWHPQAAGREFTQPRAHFIAQLCTCTFYRIHISAFQQDPRTTKFMLSLSLSLRCRSPRPPPKCPESAPAARRTSTLPRRSRPSERVGTNSASSAVRHQTKEMTSYSAGFCVSLGTPNSTPAPAVYAHYYRRR